MIYYYNVKVKYFSGNESIIKEYKKSFLEMGELFDYLEKKHKNNYVLISILPLYYISGYYKRRNKNV